MYDIMTEISGIRYQTRVVLNNHEGKGGQTKVRDGQVVKRIPTAINLEHCAVAFALMITRY